MGQQLWKHSVLRRPKEGRLGSDENKRCQFERNGMNSKTECGQRHGTEFQQFGRNRYLPLAETVGQESTSHAEQNEGCGKETHDNGNEAITFPLCQSHSENHAQQKVLEHITAVSALELRNDQRPESAQV